MEVKEAWEGGVIVWGFSFTFLFSSWWSFLIFILLLFPVYYLVRREEELIRKYGEEYKQYREQVPMFLPKIKRKGRR
ncbi:MAG TPA: hypothetical protein EYP78_01640 [Candidatus Omnitrophica bacterium]|nr:hypothetical protein [Candidatus Omnitrophota bacterium]